MPKGFLSYSRQDTAFVSQLEAHLLAAAQFDTWRDVHSLRAGDRWPRKLGDAIAASPIFILIWSTQAGASDFVELEWTIAIALKRTICIIALDASAVPPTLSPYQTKQTIDPQEAAEWLVNQESNDTAAPAAVLQKLSEYSDATPPHQIAAGITHAFPAQSASNVQGSVFQSAGTIIINRFVEPKSAFAQPQPTAHVLHGKVVKTLRENVSETVPKANITLEQTGKSVTSNSTGLFFLPLQSSFSAGEEITINIDAPGYAIFQPVGGRARVPKELEKDSVSFELLPRGSPRFFPHEHLMGLLKGVAEKSASDFRSAGDNKQKAPPDLSRYPEE